MKHSAMLTITSLRSILFGTFHVADDIARGMSPGGLPNLFAVVICHGPHTSRDWPAAPLGMIRE